LISISVENLEAVPRFSSVWAREFSKGRWRADFGEADVDGGRNWKPRKETMRARRRSMCGGDGGRNWKEGRETVRVEEINAQAETARMHLVMGQDPN